MKVRILQRSQKFSRVMSEEIGNLTLEKSVRGGVYEEKCRRRLIRIRNVTILGL